jgi:hypothetical protein
MFSGISMVTLDMGFSSGRLLAFRLVFPRVGSVQDGHHAFSSPPAARTRASTATAIFRLPSLSSLKLPLDPDRDGGWRESASPPRSRVAAPPMADAPAAWSPFPALERRREVPREHHDESPRREATPQALDHRPRSVHRTGCVPLFFTYLSNHSIFCARTSRMLSRAANAWFSRGSNTSLAVAPCPRRAWNSLSDSMGSLA